jgi:hypothetical protein
MVDLRLDLLRFELERMDAGKPCGESHISSQDECLIGQGKDTEITPKGSAAITEKATKRILSDLAYDRDKKSAEEIKAGSYNPTHPAVGWDEEAYDQYMDPYRENPKNFSQTLKKKLLDEIEEGDEGSDWAAKAAINGANFPELSKYAKSLLAGESVKAPKGGTDQILGDFLKATITDLKTSEDDPYVKSSLAKLSGAIDKGEIDKYIKRKITGSDPDFEVSQALSKHQLDQVNWDDVADAVSKRLDLPKALKIEKEQGFEGGRTKPRKFALVMREKGQGDNWKDKVEQPSRYSNRAEAEATAKKLDPKSGSVHWSRLPAGHKTYTVSTKVDARPDAIARAKTINGINYALNKNSRWERVKSGVAHGAVHLGENMAAWKVGKVVGGAIGQVAASHGADPEVARLLSETAVQALASTALYVRSGKRSGTDIATHMIAQSAAAFSGKISHTGVDDLSEMLGGSERVTAISALVAGKMAGIGTVVAAHKSGVARKLAESLPAAKTRIGSLVGSDAILERSGQRRATNARSDGNSRKYLNLAEVDNAAELVMVGYAIAALDKYRGDSMDLALELLRIDLARMDRECGRGWTGTNPPGCTRGGAKQKPPSTSPVEASPRKTRSRKPKVKDMPEEAQPLPQKPQAQPKGTERVPAAKQSGSHSDYPDYKAGKNLADVARAVSDTCGVDEEEGKFISKTINSWTKTGYKKIKKSQRADEQTPEVAAMNKFIEKSPKFDGEIYRGMAFASPKKLEDFISSVSGGSMSLDSISSFSSDKDLAIDFASGTGGTSAKSSNALLIRVKGNKSGVSVVPFSAPDHKSEAEVVAPKGAAYKMLGEPRREAAKARDRKIIKQYTENPDEFIKSANPYTLGVASLAMSDVDIAKAYNAMNKREGYPPSTKPYNELAKMVRGRADVPTVLVLDVEEV